MGNAQSELQHIANALSGMAGDEKKFIEAVLSGNTILVRDLLMANPNVIYARTKEWQNAWHIAALSGTIEMLEVLYRHGSKATRKPLPGEPTPVNHMNKKGITPLMVAVMAGREQIMQYLLAVGAEVRSKDFYGNTCVHYAALNGHVKILEMLLATADAEMEERVQPAGPPELQKIGNQLKEIGNVARILGAGAASTIGVNGLAEQLAKGRYVAFRNESGLQPLHFAVWGGNKEAVRVLLRYGAYPYERSGTDSTAEVTCNGGSTPLHLAGLRNNVNMVNFLLELYVRELSVSNPAAPPTDPRTIKDNYTFTPYQLAKNLRREDVLVCLDPRGKLPAIEDIRNSADAMRRASVTRTTTFTRSTRSSEGGEGSQRSGMMAAKFGADRSATATGEAWDPFGTAAYTSVPALPPPPGRKAASPSPSKTALPLTPLAPPPRTNPPRAPGQPLPHTPPRPQAAAAGPDGGAAGSGTGNGGAGGGAAHASPATPASGTKPQTGVSSPDGSSSTPAAAAASGDDPTDPASASGASPSAPTAAAAAAGGGGDGDDGASSASTPAPKAAAAGAAADASASSVEVAVPKEFVCPITHQVMIDPVIAADGRSYERTAIEMWLDIGNTEFPGGESKVSSPALTPNEDLKQRITDWYQQGGKQ